MRTQLLAALLLASSPVLAADHPDMAGKWVLDPVKSNFGPMPVPNDLVFDIRASGDEFTMKQTGGGQPDTELRFNTSGKEVTNELPGGARMTSTHHWEGKVLIGDVKIAVPDGTELTFKDKISYSEDGKVMTAKREMNGPMGQAQMTFVMNKQ